MKRPSYIRAVEHVALNDDPGVTDPSEIVGSVSVVLVSDLFDIEPERVARDVARYRKRAERGGA